MSKRTTKRPGRARRSSPKVHFEGGARNLTSQAGLIPAIKFLDSLGFSKIFHRHVDLPRGHSAQFQLVDVVFLTLIGMMGGARNISQCVLLWSDGVLRRAAGWVRIPVESTVGRIFKEAGERHISEIETLIHQMPKRVWSCALRSGTSRIALQCRKWVDVDSSVKTVYGRQEGVAKGYNPHKRGGQSNYPIWTFGSNHVFHIANVECLGFASILHVANCIGAESVD